MKKYLVLVAALAAGCGGGSGGGNSGSPGGHDGQSFDLTSGRLPDAQPALSKHRVNKLTADQALSAAKDLSEALYAFEKRIPLSDCDNASVVGPNPLFGIQLSYAVADEALRRDADLFIEPKPDPSTSDFVVHHYDEADAFAVSFGESGKVPTDNGDISSSIIAKLGGDDSGLFMQWLISTTLNDKTTVTASTLEYDPVTKIITFGRYDVSNALGNSSYTGSGSIDMAKESIAYTEHGDSILGDDKTTLDYKSEDHRDGDKVKGMWKSVASGASNPFATSGGGDTTFSPGKDKFGLACLKLE